MLSVSESVACFTRSDATAGKDPSRILLSGTLPVKIIFPSGVLPVRNPSGQEILLSGASAGRMARAREPLSFPLQLLHETARAAEVPRVGHGLQLPEVAVDIAAPGVLAAGRAHHAKPAYTFIQHA